MEVTVLLLKESLKIFSEQVLTQENIIECVDFAMRELKSFKAIGEEKKKILMDSFRAVMAELGTPDADSLLGMIDTTTEQLYKIFKSIYKKPKKCCFLCCCRK